MTVGVEDEDTISAGQLFVVTGIASKDVEREGPRAFGSWSGAPPWDLDPGVDACGPVP